MKLKNAFLTLSLFIAASLQASYVHIDTLSPGQVRFSSKNVEEKIEQAIWKKDVVYNPETGAYEGAYFGGKSLFPEDDALPVIRSCFGYVLADGHHHTLAALTLDLPWLPIKEIADLSYLSEQEFWTIAEEKGWVYLYGLDGNRHLPPSDFTQLEDDPNRYFAAITARKYPADGDRDRSTGAEYPLWLKVGKDIPFIEFRISDALRAKDLQYLYEMDTPEEAFVEKARQILLDANISGLRVVPCRKHYTEINLDEF